MKKLFCCVIVCFLINSVANSQTIATIRSGQYRITADLTPVKKLWEKVLTDNENSASIVNFIVKSGADQVTGVTYYLLLGSNRDQSIKVAQGLKLKGATLVFLSKEELPQGIVTCSGCSSGCDPVVANGKWICDPACSSAEKECVKTVSISISEAPIPE